MPRSRDVAIVVVMMMTDRQTKPIALPLAHVCGVIISRTIDSDSEDFQFLG